MPILQNKTLAKLQGVPVENRHDDLLDFAQDKKSTNSSTASSGPSVMKRFYKKSKIATSIIGELEAQPNSSMFSGIFSHKKAPAPTIDRSLSFINNSGQSTSMKTPTPPDMPLQIVNSPNHKSSRSVAWNRLFHRLKSKPKDEAPQQNTIPGNETEKVQEQNNLAPETQSKIDSAEPSTVASQEQQLPNDPQPERRRNHHPDLCEPEPYWKRWFYSLRGHPKDENPAPEATAGNETEEVQVKELQQVQNNPAKDLKEPPLGASQEKQLPIDPKPERSKPKTPLKSNHRPFLIQPQVYSKGWFYSFRGHSKDEAPAQEAIARNETEKLQLRELQQVQNNPKTQSAKDLKEPPLGASQEQQLLIDPEPQRLEPETPIRNDHRPNLIKPEVYKKRWFHSFRGQPKDETPAQKAFSRNQTEEMQVKELQQVQENPKTQSGNDFKEAPMGISPIEPQPEPLEPQLLESQRLDPQRLEPKMPMKSDHYPGLTQVYSKRWFYSFKGHPKEKAPEQKAIAEKETEEVLVKAVHQVKNNPETQSAKDLKELHMTASQKHPIDPEPQRLEPKMPMKREYISVAGKSEEAKPNQLVSHMGESKDAKPNQPTSDEVNWSMESEPLLLKPKIPKRRSTSGPEDLQYYQLEDAVPNQTASHEVNLLIDLEAVRVKTKPVQKISDRNLSKDVGPNQPASTEVTIHIDSESERLKTKIPKQGFSRNFAEEGICVPVAKEPEDLKPNKLPSDVAKQEIAVLKQTAPDKINLPIDMEPVRLNPITRQNISARNMSEEVKPNQSASTEVNLLIDSEAERLKTKIPEKGSVRNVTEDQTLSTFERDHRSVAAEPADAEPNRTASDVTEPEVAASKQTAPDEVNLTIYPESEHLNPNTQTKKFSRKVSKEQISSPFKRQHLSVAPEPEDAEPNEPVSDKMNLKL
ncbi:hypothetical protein KR054_009912 [Drosophila jambulina]|nr:hypothetical protein KR054_009912 [Drosophila jambulina]